LTFDVACIAEVVLMFLKMIMSWRALAGMVHLRTSSAGLMRRSEMRVVEVVVVLLYLKELYLVYVDEMKIKTGYYFSHFSYF